MRSGLHRLSESDGQEHSLIVRATCVHVCAPVSDDGQDILIDLYYMKTIYFYTSEALKLFKQQIHIFLSSFIPSRILIPPLSSLSVCLQYSFGCRCHLLNIQFFRVESRTLF